MMWRRLCSWLACLLVLLVAVTTPALARQPAPNRMQYKDQGEPKEVGPPALQYAVAAVGTIIIMVILCMPSRKRNIAG